MSPSIFFLLCLDLTLFVDLIASVSRIAVWHKAFVQHIHSYSCFSDIPLSSRRLYSLTYEVRLSEFFPSCASSLLQFPEIINIEAFQIPVARSICAGSLCMFRFLLPSNGLSNCFAVFPYARQSSFRVFLFSEYGLFVSLVQYAAHQKPSSILFCLQIEGIRFVLSPTKILLLLIKLVGVTRCLLLLLWYAVKLILWQSHLITSGYFLFFSWLC